MLFDFDTNLTFLPEKISGAKECPSACSFSALAWEYIKGGNMKIKGPVRVPPIRAITTSNRGTDSPMATARKTTADLVTIRFQPKATKALIFNKILSLIINNL